MTVLAEPATNIATANYPAQRMAPAASRPGKGGSPVHTAGTSRQTLDDAGHHPERRASVRADGTWPLYPSDPVRVDGYRLLARLGEGGMADVFHAVAPGGRPVAVKLLRAGGGGLAACLRECRLASAVDADCTASALDCGVATAGAYLVTAYLPGYRCGTTLQHQAMSPGRLWTLGLALARVLAAVHARDVVHCDVKPSNLLVRGDDIRLIDFGIARYVGEQCAADGTVACTRGWAAPEQLYAAPATPAMDVFAWGCVVAYLAGGVHPFASQSEQEWILRVQTAEPDLSSVPSGLDEVIGQALARDPRDRPSAPELATICRTRGDRRADTRLPWWPWK
jgi:serine/threonine protein kinase